MIVVQKDALRLHATALKVEDLLDCICLFDDWQLLGQIGQLATKDIGACKRHEVTGLQCSDGSLRGTDTARDGLCLAGLDLGVRV